MGHQNRDLDALIASTKTNPNLTGRQRQRAVQHLMAEKRQSDAYHAAHPTVAATPAPSQAPSAAPAQAESTPKAVSRHVQGSGSKKTSVPGIDATMKKLGIY